MTIIDGDTELRESLAFFFKQRKYQVTTYPKTMTAYYNHKELMKENVILCDLNSDGMNGVDFIKSLRKEGHQTPVILLSDGQNVDLTLAATQSGAFYHAIKPLRLEQLALIVQKASQVVPVAVLTPIPLFVGRSPQILSVSELARRFAKCDSSILITGESGTGKDVMARSIHQMSERRQKPFVAINCSAIPDDLLESELFGHARGSFTGALAQKLGLFEEASGGTLFLDEIGDMNYALQSKLLRVVQERKIRRVGETQEQPIDVRIISATHQNLKSLVKSNHFREDLYYRLNVAQIHIPPLRDRTEDIPLLCELFLRKHSPNKSIHLTKEGEGCLTRHQWKGNVRELENVIERAISLCPHNEINETDLAVNIEEDEPLPHADFFSIQRRMTLKELNQAYIEFLLNLNHQSKNKTYRELGIDRKTLYRKLS